MYRARSNHSRRIPALVCPHRPSARQQLQLIPPPQSVTAFDLKSPCPASDIRMPRAQAPSLTLQHSNPRAAAFIFYGRRHTTLCFAAARASYQGLMMALSLRTLAHRTPSVVAHRGLNAAQRRRATANIISSSSFCASLLGNTVPRIEIVV